MNPTQPTIPTPVAAPNPTGMPSPATSLTAAPAIAPAQTPSTGLVPVSNNGPAQPPSFDPAVVALMHGIKMQEGGGTVNYNAIGDEGTAAGVGQWSNQPQGTPIKLAAGQIPSNFQADATKYGLDPNDFSPANQNEVMYKDILADKNNGFSPEQILSKWNSGDPNAYLSATSSGTGPVGKYNVAQYVKNAMNYAQQYSQSQQSPGTVQPDSTAGYQPAFPASPNDNPLTAGLKATGNLPGSALNFGMGALQTVNPLNTLGNLGKIGSGFGDLANQEGVGSALLDVIKGLPAATYEAFVPQAIKQLVQGNVSGAAQSATNDPFGTAAPVVFAAEGAAKGLDATGLTEDSTGTFDRTVSNISKPVTAPLNAAGGYAGSLGMSLISHLTSLDPTTISTILQNPEDFSKLQQDALSRPSIAEEFGNAIDQAIGDKQATGAEYNGIRASGENIAVPENFFQNVLGQDKFGLNVDSEGNVTADTNSITRNPADINSIQNFMNNWSDKTNLSPREFLNMRGDIAEMSKFDSAKTGAASTVGKDLYAKTNEAMRPQIKGLKDLDERMAPQIEQFKQIKKDFLTKDGEFKDNAPSKIANALNKPALLSRMEELSPGITKRLQLLKAVEDIKRASGIKTGSYVRSIIEGGAALTGHLPALIAAILTNPSIATQLIRGFGVTGKALGSTLGTIQMLAGDTSDLKTVAKVGATSNNNLRQQ